MEVYPHPYRMIHGIDDDVSLRALPLVNPNTAIDENRERERE